MELQFGVVDHLDRNQEAVDQQFENRLKLLELYDRLGFYAYHLTEHHATPLGLAPRPGIFLSAAAQRTKRLRLAPLIYILPLYDPIILAQEICMIDQMSKGRYEVGVGRGISPYELAHFDVNYLEAKEIFDEAFEVMLLALQEEKVFFKGKYFNYRGMPIEIAPYQKPIPPMWYGPGSQSSVEWCAKHAMNIVSNKPLEAARQQFEQFKEAFAREHGAKPFPKMGMTRHIYVAESESEAKAIGERGYRLWFDRYSHLWNAHDPRPDFTDAQAGVAMGSALIAGTPEQVREEIERQVSISGLNYFVTRMCYGDLSLEETTRSVELFASEVMPKFHRLAAE